MSRNNSTAAGQVNERHGLIPAMSREPGYSVPARWLYAMKDLRRLGLRKGEQLLLLHMNDATQRHDATRVGLGPFAAMLRGRTVAEKLEWTPLDPASVAVALEVLLRDPEALAEYDAEAFLASESAECEPGAPIRLLK